MLNRRITNDFNVLFRFPSALHKNEAKFVCSSLTLICGTSVPWGITSTLQLCVDAHYYLNFFTRWGCQTFRS